jgi:hypothetical protein
MKNIIISQPWGGLGDNLQFSTLPELYSKKGYSVFISINNKVRNYEIHNLVWEKNPFIKGFLNDNQGELVGVSRQHLWPNVTENHYSIHRIEIAHGFPPTNFYPKIYYEPNYFTEYNNDIIIDLTGSSQVYSFEKYKEFIDYFTPVIINADNKKIKVITFKNLGVSPIFNQVYNYLKSIIINIEYLVIETLIQYCDILNSCDKVIIVNSGINSLVAAIKQDKPKPDVLCYNPWAHFTPQEIKGCYNYKNIEYFQSKIQ